MTQGTAVTQEMIDLYDRYTHVTLDRRVFMDALARLAGGAAAAAAILPLIEARAAAAAVIPADDPRVVTAGIVLPGANGDIGGYLARPAGSPGKLPGVICLHENRGLNDHIRDVTRRLAVAGFVGLAPDLLSAAGGTPEDPDKARELIQALDAAAVAADLRAVAAYLRTHDLTNGRVGVVGFCWGGGMANALAVADPDLDAAVAFYGRQPPPESVPAIGAQLLLHYAEMDERINAGIPAFETAMRAAGTRYTLHMYPGVQHAFHNDTSAARYNAEAAALAWDRTIAFLRAALA
jgi:carboxymethylenebutenolidase